MNNVYLHFDIYFICISIYFLSMHLVIKTHLLYIRKRYMHFHTLRQKLCMGDGRPPVDAFKFDRSKVVLLLLQVILKLLNRNIHA